MGRGPSSSQSRNHYKNSKLKGLDVEEPGIPSGSALPLALPQSSGEPLCCPWCADEWVEGQVAEQVIRLLRSNWTQSKLLHQTEPWSANPILGILADNSFKGMAFPSPDTREPYKWDYWVMGLFSNVEQIHRIISACCLFRHIGKQHQWLGVKLHVTTQSVTWRCNLFMMKRDTDSLKDKKRSLMLQKRIR